MRFELVHELPRDPAKAWALLFSDAYEAASGARSKLFREVLETRELDGGRRLRRVRITSDRELPKPIAKVVGARSLSYELIETYDPAALSTSWKVIPSKLADRVTAEGLYVLEPGPAPDTSIRRITGEVTVQIALVGNKIEDIIGNEIRSSYDKSTAFAREWLASH